MLYTFHRNEYPSPLAYLYSSFTREIRGVKRRLDGDRIIVGSVRKIIPRKFNFKVSRGEPLSMELTGGIRGKNSFFFFLSFSFRGHEFVPVRS